MFHVEHEVASPVVARNDGIASSASVIARRYDEAICNDEGGVDGVRHCEDCEERSRTKQSELLGPRNDASPVARNDGVASSACGLLAMTGDCFVGLRPPRNDGGLLRRPAASSQ